MKQFEMDCYEVVEADGGGMHDLHICFVGSSNLAETLVARSKGYRRYVKHNKTYTVFDTLEEVDANSKANLRKSGLAKLTNLEKEALGL
jgi:hypothetical protein